LATPPEIPWKWRQVATPKDVASAAFAQLVLENKLEVIKSGGYMYAANKTDDGYDLYRTFDDWGAIPVSTGATADPAAGANPATITVPAGKRWQFIAWRAILVNDATVANRYLTATVTPDGTNYTRRFFSVQAQPASTTHIYVLHPGTPGEVYDAGNTWHTIGMGLSLLELSAGATITFATTGIVAGDNWGIAYYEYKEAPV